MAMQCKISLIWAALDGKVATRLPNELGLGWAGLGWLGWAGWAGLGWLGWAN